MWPLLTISWKMHFFGIYVQAGINCRIENNDIKAYAKSEQQSGNGIHCWKCDSLLIRKNHISGHRDGIYFEFVTNSMIELNVSEQQPAVWFTLYVFSP